ncbi:ML domain-containing protein [Coprinopsis sp. MPI-PUGE-AT-0042]|nr:ML domain-containing protein [Coprinopsis sp. MPI-PUGE-AT-0042]
MRFSSLALLPAFLVASSSVANPVILSDEQFALAADGPINVANKWSWEDCGQADWPVQVKSIEVSPDPPKPGQDLSVKVNAQSSETIDEGAYADVTVKLGLVKLLQKTFDVCEEARTNNVTIQCPVDPGEYTITQTVALPKEIPRAKFNVLVQGYTPEDDPMLCIKLNVDFMISFPRPRQL